MKPGPIILLSLALLCSASCQRTSANRFYGNWNAYVLTPSNGRAAFRLEIAPGSAGPVGTMINGTERIESTSSFLAGDDLELRFDFYDASLKVRRIDRDLKGAFTRQWRKQMLVREFQAVLAEAEAANVVSALATAPFTGTWVLNVGSGESARVWSAQLREESGEVRGTISTISGDWGTLTGVIRDGELVLTRFDGINARVVRARSAAEGRLEGSIDSGARTGPVRFMAERETASNLAGLPDPAVQSTIRNPKERFRFSFPDVDGRIVSSTDERFAGKVVVVTLNGTWCPNCYDEAPFLDELYARYRGEGLEVVGLSFEYTGAFARDAEQVRIFAKRLQLKFPMLVAGTTDEGDVERKLPQLDKFTNVFPTTIFVGRDGLVRRIHTGFEGKAAGDRSGIVKNEMEQLVKELLAQEVL
jgi:thiol-disulfide isomerase/thioredoxin